MIGRRKAAIRRALSATPAVTNELRAAVKACDDHLRPEYDDGDELLAMLLEALGSASISQEASARQFLRSLHVGFGEIAPVLWRAPSAKPAVPRGPAIASAAGVLAPAIDEYVEDLAARGSALSFGDPGVGGPDGGPTRSLVALADIWTPLRVADSHQRAGKSGTQESMAEGGEGEPVEDLVFATDDSLVLLGDPGSGKSTSVARIAVESALGYREKPDILPIPIWVTLSSISAIASESPIESLLTGVPEIGRQRTKSGAEAASRLTRELGDFIRDGRALLLLDGLDEAHDHLLPELRGLISEIARSGRCRVIATCREFDYRQTVPNRKLLISRELELLPFSARAQTAYVTRWYQAAVRVGPT